MQTPRIPLDEARRLDALRHLDVLDTPPEPRFDRLTRVAQRHFQVPIALVSLVDAERQWFKSKQGLDACETGRDISFCGHAVLADDIFHIPNALDDPRFADNPLVTDGLKIRFYAGAPLHAPDGSRVGTLCIIDDQARQFSAAELSVLRDLADAVEAELQRTHLLRNQAELVKKERQLQHLIQVSPGVIYACKASGDFGMTFVSERVHDLLGFPAQAFVEDAGFWQRHLHPDDRNPVFDRFKGLLETGHHAHEYRFRHVDGRYRWLYDKQQLVRDETGQPTEIVGVWMDITERKHGEESLAQFKTTLDRTRDGVFMFRPDTLRFFYANHGALLQLGYSAEALLGMTPLDLKPEFDEARFRAVLDPMLRGEQDSVTLETVHRHRDGHLIPVEVFLQYVAPVGEPPRFVNIVRDISERKQAEADRRTSESRIRAIVDTVVDGIISIDAHGSIQTANPEAERIFGYRREEMQGRNVNMLMPDPYHSAHDGYLHNYLSTGNKKIIGIGREVTGRRKDGSTFPMELAVSEMQVAGERMFTGIVRDITERKRIEAELKSSEARIRAVVDTVVDGIISIDAHGSIQTANPAAERLFGYRREEMQGRNVNMLMPDPYHSAHDGYLHNYLSTGKKKIIGIGREVIGRRKDGSTFPMELAVSEMLVGDERMFTGIVRDISERKRLERIKSEFVSTVSHELRTPLTSIRGALGLVMGRYAEALPEKARHMLAMAERNSERLTLLINDILDLEKIESGRLDFEFKPADLLALVRRALDDNEGYARRHDVHLRLLTDVREAAVYGDEHRLLQVLANLISNAVKYSPKDGEVWVSVLPHAGGFRVAVRDYGSGIPDEFRSRIFQRFAQADSSDTREKGGTGLGLSITKAIIEKHGGSLDYTTEIGAGSEFFFDLAAQRASPPCEAVSSQPASVLICEDNADVAEILAALLEDEGQRSDIAATAAAARELLEKNSYQLLLLDLSLPDADGLALLRELRERPATQALPVIVVSGRAEEGRSQAGSGLQVLDWLQKPVDQARLASALAQALRQGRMPLILHVEDDTDIIQVTQILVEGLGNYAYVSSLAEARAWLAQHEADLILLDLTLPDGCGLELLDELKGRIPVLVFSGQEPGPSVTERVAAALTKSRASNEQLLTTIRQILNRKGEPDA